MIFNIFYLQRHYTTRYFHLSQDCTFQIEVNNCVFLNLQIVESVVSWNMQTSILDIQRHPPRWMKLGT